MRVGLTNAQMRREVDRLGVDLGVVRLGYESISRQQLVAIVRRAEPRVRYLSSPWWAKVAGRLVAVYAGYAALKAGITR